MGFLSVLSYAQQLVKERVQPGDFVVDATMGTGVDTLFLARLVGPRGAVAAFDVQEQALVLTQKRLHEADEMLDVPKVQEASRAARSTQVGLHLASHADMLEVLPPTWHGKTAAVMFNLGYLPTADANKAVITESGTTLKALESAMTLLRPGGVLSIVLYPGHDGGDREADAVLAWATALPQGMGQAVTYRMPQRPHAPYAIGVEKR
ncbi:tRNA (mnm(5)s(2)U34)-methyltransferase [Paenibacillus sp. 481]|uniref:tRNA (mnm(5)s(2)U34)-methyltransferase n=1 Tax=Paenibacillus sp. 481 TaxID=2835869 RepID=UPI001E49ABEC|nr:class I SAM-dependent methyltransferase [Paenibacillus sp. 481]UHA72240.1 SAM-dependent methyltransferase [Paenibacillus sp. 481]